MKRDMAKADSRRKHVRKATLDCRNKSVYSGHSDTTRGPWMTLASPDFVLFWKYQEICSCRRQRKTPGSAWATRTGHYKLIDRSRSSRRKQIKRSISNHIILESLSMRFHGSADNKFPLCSILPELFSFCFTFVHDIFSEGDLCCFDKPASFSVCWSSAWRPPGRDLAQREKHDGRKVATAEF